MTSGEPARPDLEALIKQHFAMTWINYPDYPAKCFLDGIAWPCEVGTLARYALAQEARGADLERRAERAERELEQERRRNHFCIYCTPIGGG